MSPQHNIFKPKIKSEKRELAKVQVVQPNSTSWHKSTQVEQVEQVEVGLQIYVEQVEQEQGGLQIDLEQVEQGQGVCPVEPLHLTQSGTTRPCTIDPWTIKSINKITIPGHEYISYIIKYMHKQINKYYYVSKTNYCSLMCVLLCFSFIRLRVCAFAIY